MDIKLALPSLIYKVAFFWIILIILEENFFMIKAEKLTRKYGPFTAVDEVSFEIAKGMGGRGEKRKGSQGVYL